MADDYHDFDKSELLGYDEDVVAQAAKNYPEIYDNHLQIAAQLDEWAARALRMSMAHTHEADEAFARGLREVATRLRQADYVPGGKLLRRP